VRGGIDLGGTKIEAVVVDDDDRVVAKARRPTPREGGPEDVARALAEAVREAAEDQGALEAVGVGSPGSVDTDAGTVRGAMNLPGWSGTFPLGDVLGKELGVPVRVGNDVGVAVEAEAALGAGRGYGSFLGVWWGTGVGGALFLDGKRWLGRGSASELGHMVVKIGGARCPCGRRGCVEAYAGRGPMEQRAREAVEKGVKTKLFELMEKRGRNRLTSSVWANALEREDALAVHLVDRAMRALAAGAASVVNLLDVEAVVLGGGLGTRLGEPFAARLREEMLPHLFRDDRPPDVLTTALGDLGGAIGAARLARVAPGA
jgi:glucokinase